MAYPEFRKQLDTILRTKNPQAVSQFLISQGQWSENAQIDVERAMWMMIAGSQALRELHSEAQTWLMSHGYETEARALSAQEKASSTPAKSSASPKKGPAKRKSLRES